MDSTQKTEFMRSVTKHQGILHKICWVYCNNRDDRDDMYQEIVLQLWKSYPNFRGKSAFSTWVYRVALNTALTIIKKPKLFSDSGLPNNITDGRITDIEVEEELRILYSAISKLNKIEKAVILLWLEEKTYDEIAELTGISSKNVSVKLVRIKQKLEKLIKSMV